MAEQEEEDRYRSELLRWQDRVPVPDPTRLTTAQLFREITNLRELLDIRLDAMDKAAVLFADNLTRVPTEVDKAVTSLRTAIETRLDAMDRAERIGVTNLIGFFDQKFLTYDEKFKLIQKQFDERDVRTEQAAIATKIAVDAALQAQKEAAGAQNESNAAAITKAETATVKQIDGITALLNSNTTALSDKIADVKGRLDRGEGTTVGQSETKSNVQTSIGTIISIIGVCVAIVVALIAVLQSRPQPAPLYTTEPPAVSSPAH